MNMFGSQIRPEQSFALAQAINLVDDINPSLDLQIKPYEAKIGSRSYTFYLFEFDNKKYWHPYGNIVPYRYRFGEFKRNQLYKYAKDKFPDRKLPKGFGIELDHCIPNTFVTAMSIRKTEKVTVLVPKFANAIRTNSEQETDDFMNFDWRLNIEEKLLGEKTGLSTLVQNRLDDAIFRNLYLYCLETKHVTKLKKKSKHQFRYI